MSSVIVDSRVGGAADMEATVNLRVVRNNAPILAASKWFAFHSAKTV